MKVTGYINNSVVPTTSFPATAAAKASYATKSGNSSLNSGYFWFESSASSGLGGSPFGWTYWSSTSLRIQYRNSFGYTTNYNYTPPSANNGWVHVSFENIDWTAKTFDIVVDGTTLITGAQFYYNAATDVADFSGYTYASSAIYYLDYIQISGGTSIDLTYSPQTANLAGGNNLTFNFTADATNLLKGTYYLTLKLSSNDTAIDGSEIPII